MVSPTATVEWPTPHLTHVSAVTADRPAATAPSTRRWSLRRTNVAVGLVAAAIALWLGLTAPSVSPVSAPAVVVAGTAADTTVGTTGTTPGVTAVVPTPPAPPVGVTERRGGRGPGR